MTRFQGIYVEKAKNKGNNPTQAVAKPYKETK